MAIWRGILHLLLFRADGFAWFAATPQAFLGSLAPLLAFPLMASLLLMASGAVRFGAAILLASVVSVLTPPVISHAFARLWHSEARWLRYATAQNWCQFAIMLATVLSVMLYGVVAPGGFDPARGPDSIMAVMVTAVVFSQAFALVQSCFLAARGLGLGVPRGIAVALAQFVGGIVLVMGAQLAARVLR